ncbi:Vacuolar protein sorting-associated protein 62 [Lasiodiplodia hormozganensis]|uniref:Vacuolar protein sorting-associated protein 62 n=1 Tax=Lasiodiplodia hormozganensis TaxID=869390 RepID=A0AA39Z0Z3_9PEZI|nr:Vacuolar protein sorting-associated protein 62 [Lasiodiplodia hormozganensis]
MRFAKSAGGAVLLAAQLARAQCSEKAYARSSLGKRAVEGVPQFVLDYAPLSYIHHEDVYFPSDLQAQIDNTQPEVDFNVIADAESPLNLNNLDSLNSFGKEVYLTSKDDITQSPPWLGGVKPDCNGKTDNAITAAVIVNDKGNGTVDAFYMYFYAYNWGGVVLDLQVGNHVGDWEHNMVRFEDGEPKWVWYSQHSNGQNFAYDILHKSGDRPINYVANGTHANYAIPGTHDHTIPNFNLPTGLLLDHTEGPDDGGLLWDPLLSAYFYNYTNATGTPTFTVLGDDDSTPTSWLNYLGKWGDEEYPEDDDRQQLLFGGAIAKYASGPTGPIAKQLDRKEVCPSNGNLCIYRWILAP